MAADICGYRADGQPRRAPVRCGYPAVGCTSAVAGTSWTDTGGEDGQASIERAYARAGSGKTGPRSARRPTVTNDNPASRHNVPAIQNAIWYCPSCVRIAPAPNAAIDAPS